MKADELEKRFNVKPEDVERWDAGAENGVLPGAPLGGAVVGTEQPTLHVTRDNQDLVNVDGSRRFVVYGDPEWGWWIEIASDGAEIPGLWEYLEDEEKVVRACS